MKQNDKICHRVLISNLKQREAYLKREQNHIENTPKIIVGKLQNSVQQIWTDQLIHHPVQLLKQISLSQNGPFYARSLIVACKRLALRYGYFIVNENMVFLNQQKDILVWINPMILQNRVKIYLPNNYDGEAIMIRSIISFLRLWFKCDYHFLGEAKHLDQLLAQFDVLAKRAQGFIPKSPIKTFATNHQHSTTNLEGSNFPRYSANSLNVAEPASGIEHRSKGEICLGQYPEKQSMLFKSLSSKQKGFFRQSYKPPGIEKEEASKNKTSLSRNTDQMSDKNVESLECEFDKKSVTSIKHATKLGVNKSQGIRGGSNYFPNRTTSNKSHPIVELINSQDNAGEYRQNKILIQEDYQLSSQRKMEVILDGIGEQINELFFSNMQSEQNKEEEMLKIEEEFGSLLN